MKEKQILEIIGDDKWMKDVLKTVKTLALPDWWVGAGFVRGKVWDHLHNYKIPTPLADVDVIYFDPDDFGKNESNSESTKMEKKYEAELSLLMSGIKWSVTNQARMHIFHAEDKPYKNSTEALSRWIETATCVGVKLNSNNELELTAPHGIKDLTHLLLKPTIKTPEGIRRFNERIKEKGWLKKWPKLKVIES